MNPQGLTRAQRRVARLVLQVAGPAGFHLAGGAALVACRLSDRPTRDIDAFTAGDVDVGAVGDAVAAALRRAGDDVVVNRRSSSFVSMTVTPGGARRGRLEVDLGRDAIAWPTVTTALGPTLSPRELAANKVLALFGRVQPRDLADLQALAQRHDLPAMLADATSKDTGFDRRVLAEMVRLVVARPDPEWPVAADVDRLRRFGTALATALERGDALDDLT
ncbi:MAG TPA: nucleotidyl transferase AbiEii/AbiGii toxin family protein [Acidimicrobiales bacterium]|nr:nucleotidyl transferase AbiEii/AbiGii toxin family protein [Acidimicrobiales bacterium]